MTKGCISLCRFLALVMVCHSGWVCADTLIFKNGRTMDVIVKEETDETVTVLFGAGEMRFDKSQLERIERAKSEENAMQAAAWRKANFLHADYVPGEEKAFASLLRSLPDLRAAAEKEMQRERSLRQELHAASREHEELLTQLHDVHVLLSKQTNVTDILAYNAQVADSQRLSSALKQLEARRARLQKALQSVGGATQRYMKEVLGCEEMLQEREGTKQAKSPDREAFLALAREMVSQHARSLQSYRAPVVSSGGGLVVRVRINDRVSGLFVVDTGASVVTLFSSFAQKAGISGEGMTMQARLADGRLAQGRRVTLSSVMVGQARAEDVAAVVLETGGGTNGYAGLLGMSFLNRFRMEMDSGKGELILRDFRLKR